MKSRENMRRAKSEAAVSRNFEARQKKNGGNFSDRQIKRDAKKAAAHTARRQNKNPARKKRRLQVLTLATIFPATLLLLLLLLLPFLSFVFLFFGVSFGPSSLSASQRPVASSASHRANHTAANGHFSPLPPPRPEESTASGYADVSSIGRESGAASRWNVPRISSIPGMPCRGMPSIAGIAASPLSHRPARRRWAVSRDRRRRRRRSLKRRIIHGLWWPHLFNSLRRTFIQPSKPLHLIRRPLIPSALCK